jgi:hypothetical protein
MNDDTTPTQAPLVATRLGWLSLVLGLLLVTASGRSATADPTYRFVDSHGTITFTDNESSIPDQYRDQVTVLTDPRTATDSMERSDSVAERITPTTGGPSDSGWWSRLSIPLPSRFQTGVGLTALTLSLGIGIAIRASRSTASRVALKLSLLAVMATATYVLSFTTLNERISVAAGDDARQQASGTDVAQRARRAITSLTTAVDHAADATVGAARRAADAVNQANQEIDHVTQPSDTAP